MGSATASISSRDTRPVSSAISATTAATWPGSAWSCSCSGLLSAPDFLGLLRAAARKAERPVQLLDLAGAAADHPVALEAPEGAYLKVAWLRIGDPSRGEAMG